MEIHNRIAQILQTEDITAKLFSEKLGVERSSISHLLSGRNKPSIDFLDKFFNIFPDYNPLWLISGKGEMKITVTKERVTYVTQESHTIQEPQKLFEISEIDVNKINENIIKNEQVIENITIVKDELQNEQDVTKNDTVLKEQEAKKEIETNQPFDEKISQPHTNNSIRAKENSNVLKMPENETENKQKQEDCIKRIVIFFDNGLFETFSERK